MSRRVPGLRTRVGLELFRTIWRERVARHELRTLFRECTLRCNLSCRHCGSDCSSSSGANDPGLQLTDRQFTDLLKFIENTRREGMIEVSYACEGFPGGYETRVRNNFYQCNAGVSTASILADGDISGCLSIRSDYHRGNIYRDDFMDVWNNRFGTCRDRKWMRTSEPCSDCAMFRYCQGGGMHLRGEGGRLSLCHYRKLKLFGQLPKSTE